MQSKRSKSLVGVDLANGNFRPAAGSQLLDVVPRTEWMGTGKRDSKLDLGTGYELRSTGERGIRVVWTDAQPRIFRGAADIGCCELWYPPGMNIRIK